SVSERCLAAGVEGLRADLTLCQAACAWAAYQGRRAVESTDLDAVAELALAHRRTLPPEPPPDRNQESGVRGQRSEVRGQKSEVRSQGLEGRSQELTEDIAGLFAARVRPPSEAVASSGLPGQWRSSSEE